MIAWSENGSPCADVGDGPADERRGDDGDPAHRRRALLGHVVLGAEVLLAEDRLAEATGPERRDQEAGHEQRQDPGDDAGDHDGDHCSSSRTTARSSNGSTRSPIVCVVSWPLPATTTTSSAPAWSSAGAIAARRSGSTDDLRPVSCRHAADHVGDDGGGILRPWVVGCHDDPVGERGGDGPHRRALGVVAVAARSEHDEHAPRRHSPRRGDHLLQTVGRVGVVDDHHRPVGRPLDQLEAARDGPRRGEPGDDVVGADAEDLRRRRRGERVGHVEAAAETDDDPPAVPRVGVAIGPDLDVADHRRRVRHHLDARRIEEEPAVGVVDVGHADRRQLGCEQAGLGPEVLLDGAVQVEVVRAEVGEHRRGEPRAVHPVHRHGV